MMRCFAFLLAWIGTTCVGSVAWAAYPSAMINQSAAAAHGLTRAWFSQVQMDGARGRILHLTLHQGTLFVQTDQAMLHAFDAETGQTLWAEQVGEPLLPTFSAGANSNHVAVVNGSSLYVLNRFNGKLLWKTQLVDAPGAGAAMSERFVYVPMVNGLVYAYLLRPAEDPVEQLRREQSVDLTAQEQASVERDRREGVRISQEKIPPLVCTSFGETLIQPLVTRQAEGTENVAWTTSRGMLFVGEVDEEGNHFASRYHLVTNGPITSQPAYLPSDVNIVGDSGVIYGASEDGFVYAIRESDGQLLWRFSTGEPIVEQSVVVGLRVYVPTQTEGLHCLDAKTGKEIWWTAGIRRFLAASKDRIYAADRVGRLIILSAQSGARLDTMDLAQLPIKMTNDCNDRLYVASPMGLIQCLHEIELTQPVFHRQEIMAKQKTAAGEKKPAAGEKKPGPQEKPADNPFAPQQPEKAADPFAAPANQANPFDAGAKQPAGANDNPFQAAPASKNDNPFN